MAEGTAACKAENAHELISTQKHCKEVAPSSKNGILACQTNWAVRVWHVCCTAWLPSSYCKCYMNSLAAICTAMAAGQQHG
jgi:hypothetical protein